MLGDILFILVVMVAAITLFEMFAGNNTMASSNIKQRRYLTPIQVLTQKDADAFVNGPISPGPAALADKRAPYALLEYLNAYRGASGVTTVGSQNCYDGSSPNFRMKSSYAQMVNNYPHEYPDSCSGTRQEFVRGVYPPPR